MPYQPPKETSIETRPVTSEDRDFLIKVYEAARAIELSMVPWDAAMKRAFVEHQFDAQLLYYATEYPDARHDVITLSVTGEHVGRIYVNRTPDQIAILDITVLPEFRRRGIGSAVIGELIREAEVSRRAVRVYVETFNPSQKFFLSRGFAVENDDGFNLRLVRRPRVKNG
jgi:ribosomal protein S18 acetylase RimI-like enzyme